MFEKKPFAKPSRPTRSSSQSSFSSSPAGNRTYETRRPPEKEMVFGIRAIIEAIDAGKTIDKILIRRDMTSTIGKELLKKLMGTTTPVQKVPVEKLNQYPDKNHQGAIAFLSPIEFCNVETLVPTLFEEGKTPLLMVLDGVTDVRNFGGIARSAECAGAHGIISSLKNSAPVNADSIRSSAGALTRIPVARVGSIRNTLKSLQAEGFQVVAATEHSRKLMYDADLRKPTVIVMGSEEKGISKEVLKLCDEQLAIPMIGAIESLNVSAAAAIMLFEVVRQRIGE